MVVRAIEAAAGGIEQLAADVGVSYATMWAWANGKRNPTPANLRKLARVLRRRSVKLEELANRIDEEVAK